MFFNYDKLITTGLKVKVFYHFSVGLLNRVTEMLSGNAKIEPYISIFQQRMKKLEKVYFHDRKSPLTSKIQRKHKERTNLLAGLRRQINSALKMVFNPDLVKEAEAFKQAMKGNDWWNYDDLSYTFTSLLINNMLDEITTEPYAQWVETLSLHPLFDGLKKAHEEFESLFASRLDGQNGDETFAQTIAKKNLLYVANVILTVIDFGASTEPTEFAEIAKNIGDLVTVANSQTKSDQTRSQSGNTVPAGEPSTDLEVETAHENTTQSAGEAGSSEVTGLLTDE